MVYFFRLGRWVKADAAAVFAAALDFGFLSTFAAADAARARVTSLFVLRAILIYPYFSNLIITTIDMMTNCRIQS